MEPDPFIDKKFYKDKLYSEDKFNINIPNLDDLMKNTYNPLELEYTRPSNPTPRKRKDAVSEILSPLDSVFFDDRLMDDLVVRCAIPQLLSQEVPGYQGVILFGPGGTGKSEFQKAVCEVYRNAGAYAEQVSSSALNSCFVGQLAKNLEEVLQRADSYGKSTKLPVFVSFDEGTIFAQNANVGGNSVSKHYQEAIDVMKRYIGNECGKWIVLGISTNSLPQDFEEAMTREGRLTSFFIDYPKREQLARMWKYFLNKYSVIDINEEQANELAELSGGHGALINQFCSNYLGLRRHELLSRKGYPNLLTALKKGVDVPDEEVKKSMDYTTLRTDLLQYIQKMILRENGFSKKEETGFGFGRKK